MKHGICERKFRKTWKCTVKKEIQSYFFNILLQKLTHNNPLLCFNPEKMKVCFLRIRKGVQGTFRKFNNNKKVITNFQIFFFTYTWHKCGMEWKFYELQSEMVNPHYLRLTESPLVWSYLGHTAITKFLKKSLWI